MKLALSNFAWEFSELETISEVLHKNNIEYIELVFPKYDTWENITIQKLIELKHLLDSHNLKVLSTQSLFYNVDCTSITTDSNKFISHVKKLIEFSKILGIKVLVFGSPGLRKSSETTDLSLQETFTIIDELLDGTDIIFCIEPNSKLYGGDFFYTVKEIVNS